MKREILSRLFWSIMVCAVAGVLLVLGAYAIAEDSKEKAPDAKPAAQVFASVDGTCTFMGRGGTWSAKLTPDGDGVYKAVYVADWDRNKNMGFQGTLKTDGKEISGNGKSDGSGGGNGTFEFSGTFDDTGVAKCNYKEIGGRGGMGRTGTMTANKPK
jgi:hypothetical protein